MSDRDTISIYDEQAQRYAELTDESNKADRGMTDFIAAVPNGGRVLDLGCGPGASAVIMAQAGLVVDATDASAEMVRMAAAHPDVQARQAEFDDLDAVRIYDGIWANFSLLHAKRSEFPAHLRAINTALKPGGVLYIAMKLGQGEGPDRLGRFYCYYDAPELEGCLRHAGFTVTGRWTGSGTGLDGSESEWIRLAAHA